IEARERAEARLRRMHRCGQVHAIAREQRAVVELERRFEYAAYVAALSARARGPVQAGGAVQGEAAQEGDGDPARVVAFDQYRRPITGCREMPGAQALEDVPVLDLLQGEDVGTAAVVHLQDDGCQPLELAFEHGIAPVPREAGLPLARAAQRLAT